MVTVAWAGLQTLTLLGVEDGSIARTKLSFLSKNRSSKIVTKNEVSILPAAKVASCNPAT